MYHDEEPEPCGCEDFSMLEDAIKGEVSFGLDVADLERQLSLYAQKKFASNLETFINREVSKCVESAYGAKYTFENALKDVIAKKLDEKYPGIVDDKVDELAEKIKATEFEWNRREQPKAMMKKAQEKVDEYIDSELSKSVERSVEYVEEFSRNYFANNLFRAMGMIDKMIPQANADNISKQD